MVSAEYLASPLLALTNPLHWKYPLVYLDGIFEGRVAGTWSWIGVL